MTREILRYQELTKNEIEFYKTYGYLCLAGLLTREMAAALAEEVLKVMAGLGLPREEF